TAIPPLTDAEKLEFGPQNDHRPAATNQNKLVVASYNIRYARGPYLISGGVRRKLGLMNLSRRPPHVKRLINDAARAFSSGALLHASMCSRCRKQTSERVAPVVITSRRNSRRSWT